MNPPTPRSRRPAGMNLQETMLRLRNAAPDAFDQLVRDLEAYTKEAYEILGHAEHTAIQVKQGHVQQCEYLLRLLRECHLQSEKKPTP